MFRIVRVVQTDSISDEVSVCDITKKKLALNLSSRGKARHLMGFIFLWGAQNLADKISSRLRSQQIRYEILTPY